MVRPPCCENMGLKKGPWTPDEDQILISYIEKNGHGNWRALPKQAGLSRCGKSCRLRWINYLRPDIKRGNFTREEEETIIKLHEMMGNRWSAIAAKLPGRTDNEIKNVWHTHLKKRLIQKASQWDSVSKRTSEPRMKRSHSNSSTITQSEASSFNFSEMDSTNSACTSSSDFSSVTVGESKNMDTSMSMTMTTKREDTEPLEAIVPEIDESFWSEAAIIDENTTTNMPSKSLIISNQLPVHQHPFDSYGNSSNQDDGMDFWYDLFIRSGDSIELPDF